MIVGAGALAYLLLHHKPAVTGIAGIDQNRRKVYNKIFFNMGYDDSDVASKNRLTADFNKMTLQQVIFTAYKKWEIFVVNENSGIRQDLVKRYASATGKKYNNVLNNLRNMTLPQLLYAVKIKERDYIDAHDTSHHDYTGPDYTGPDDDQ